MASGTEDENENGNYLDASPSAAIDIMITAWQKLKSEAITRAPACSYICARPNSSKVHAQKKP